MDIHEIRKHVYHLTLDDLERCAQWEFALDEEGLPGQDESTVRPKPDWIVADAGNGLCVVKTKFVAADGSLFKGFCTPQHDNELSHIQPTIVTPQEHVSFWFGMMELPRDEMKKYYGLLGKDGATLFPLRFEATMPVEVGFASGVIPGFQYFKKSSRWRKRNREVATIT